MTKKIRPRITEEEYEFILGIRNAAKESNLDVRDVPHGWIKSDNASLFFKNPAYEPPEEKIEDIDFRSIFYDVKPSIVIEQPKAEEAFFDRLVYSDTHIGLEPNKNGTALYGGKWDEEELDKRLNTIVNWTLANRKSSILFIDDLGDFQDGWDGKTVRREHDLPQNMTNQQCYEVGVNFKVRMIDALVPYYDEIQCHNICEDNHSGDFGAITNQAFKAIAELKYPDKVKVHNQKKFIDHYQVGKYTFILTHGKDSKNLKFGFKPQLDDKQVSKINNYIDEHFLYQPGVHIEFSKGDSHQYLFDNTTAQRFNYYNYPALSPSSNWVQTNFQKGKSGFVHFNYYENPLERTINDRMFQWHSTK